MSKGISTDVKTNAPQVLPRARLHILQYINSIKATGANQLNTIVGTN